ncbi:hypothetical protein ACFCVU_24400, partial [Peribacillus butanolivorans]|uniref:hypothetical protein n=1 Tax=Peribacillus butanolivorans TaxID=421767 RepID=UPI0035E01B3A
MSFFRSPNPFFNLPCTVCCITKGATDSLGKEVKHPLANHAAHDQRCTTENENGGKPSILILWLG